MTMSRAKQVIIMRKDLGMRKGKMISQGAHASMKVLLNMMREDISTSPTHVIVNKTLSVVEGTALDEWLHGLFTKVCLQVNSEEELLDLYDQAKAANLPCALIEDAGLTEFNGVKTNTCIAIGPAYSKQIDEITNHLKLL